MKLNLNGILMIFFVSDESFLDSLENIKKQLESLSQEMESFSLEQKLQKYYVISLLAEKLVSYAELHSDLDISNEKYLQYKNQAYLEKSKLDTIKNQIDKEILAITISLEEYMHSHKEARSYFMHFYDVFRLKEHTKSSSAITNENVLINRVNSLYNTLIHIEMPLEEIELAGELTKVNFKIYNKYITNQDRAIREKVFKTFMRSLKSVNKSISSLFLMRYQMCYDIAKEEGYSSILEQLISKDDLDSKIITHLITTVHENLPVLNRYIALKKQKLGVENFHFYDLNVTSDYNPKYSFLEGIAIVKKALKPLGKIYEETLDKVLHGGMLDVFSHKHKFAGGYHWRNYTKPMILMNYKENFREVATIGHELGHAVNGILIRDNQEFQNFHFSIFLAEIASMVNEDRVEEYMYRVAEEENKIIHLEQIIDKTITAIFFQTLLFEFQKEICAKIENGEVVSADFINDTFLNLFQQYYPGITIDDELKYLWETRIHLFYDVHRYYNFQYAIGKIVALVINRDIQNGNVSDYLHFLTIGGSKPTLEALSIAGVDLTQKEVYENAIHYLNCLLDEYEQLLNK